MKNRTTQLHIPYYSPCYVHTTKTNFDYKNKSSTTITKPHKAYSSINIFQNELQEYLKITDHNILDSHLTHKKKEIDTEYCKEKLDIIHPSPPVIIKKKQRHT